MSETTAPTGSSLVFEEHVVFIRKQIDNRRRNWTLTTLPWEDVHQIILIRVWQKWDRFDREKGPFDRWLNRLITNALKNILRDHLFRWQRPCIRDGGCVYNLGGNSCYYTGKLLGKSGLQCEECPTYAKWKAKKEPEYNIKSSLALEQHAQEVNNMPADSLDVARAKEIIDEKMMRRLRPWEKRIYKLLYVRNLSPLEASEELKKAAAKRKTPLDPDDAVDYQAVLKISKTMKEMMVRIIKAEDLV